MGDRAAPRLISSDFHPPFGPPGRLSITGRDRSVIDWALLVARVFVGVIFMAHGAQKLFGAFGGPGLSAVVQMTGPFVFTKPSKLM
jgi:DoxX-like protein